MEYCDCVTWLWSYWHGFMVIDLIFRLIAKTFKIGVKQISFISYLKNGLSEMPIGLKAIIFLIMSVKKFQKAATKPKNISLSQWTGAHK